MSLSRLWLSLAVALPVLASLLATLSTVDLAYQLRAGSEILGTGAIPRTDTWTFTVNGQPWIDQQWGTQVVLALVERVGGWTGLALFRAALVGGIVGGLLIIARRRGLSSRTAALLVLAAFLVMAPALALRPQLLGMACFVGVLLLVTDRRSHPGRLWAVVPLVALWANLHGSFFLGPLVLGLAWIEDLHDRDPGTRRTLFVTIAGVVAACLTPFGPFVWAYAASLSANPAVTSRITEWQPTSLRDVPGTLFFASVAAVVVMIARRDRPVPWPMLAWLGVFVAIGVFAQRGLAWWPLAAVPALAGGLLPADTDPLRQDPPAMRRANAIVMAAAAIAAVALVPIWRPVEPGLRAPAALLAHAPAGVTAALRDVVRPRDHLLAPQVWGSWFEYAVPDALVAVDSRIELFPASVWADHELILMGGDGWQDRLEAWGVDLVVTTPAQGSLVDRLTSAGWVVAYTGADGSLLTAPGGTARTETIGAVTWRTGLLESGA